LRIENSIKALHRVCDLHIISRVSKHKMGGQLAEDYYRNYGSDFRYTPLAANQSFNRRLKKLHNIYRILVLPSDDNFIIDYAKQHDINIIWFGYGNVSFPLIKKIKKKSPDLKVVCDTDSVWSRFILRALPYENDSAKRKRIQRSGKDKKREEKEWVNLCEVTTAVSEVDADYYREIAKDSKRIKIFSNVIDISTYREVPPRPNGLKNPSIYLAGTFYPGGPMDNAARWVTKEVLPLLTNKIPDIHFYIVGSGSKETLSDIESENITITGKLPSVLEYLCHSDVSLVPLKYESGTRFKILEAGACGIPIVSTTVGAEGISITDGKDILIADQSNDFAKAIVKIIRDQAYAKRLSQNLKKLIEKYYDLETPEKEAKEIIHFLCH